MTIPPVPSLPETEENVDSWSVSCRGTVSVVGMTEGYERILFVGSMKYS